MIHKFLHQILDNETRLQYRQQIKSYYSKLTPIITVLLLIFSITIEVLQRTETVHPVWIYNTTSALNWASVVFMTVMSVLVRKFYFSCMCVGPFLTLFVFYYFSLVDFDHQYDALCSVQALCYTVTYAIMVYAMENWLFQAIVSVPVFSIFTWRQQQTKGVLEHTEVYSILRCVFLIIIYSAIAFRVDKQNKLACIGSLSTEKTFQMWLKTFESFPEGICLIRNGVLIYANNEMRSLFNLETVKENKIGDFDGKHNNQSAVQKHFELRRIRKLDEFKHNSETTIWEFVKSETRHGRFELLPMQGAARSNEQDASQEIPLVTKQRPYSPENSTFVQLRQVYVTMSGRQEKLLIVTNESDRVKMGQFKEKEQNLQDFTYEMITKIDSQITSLNESLKVVNQTIQPEGIKFVEECQNEVSQMRYGIRDFDSIYNISQEQFEIPKKKYFDVEQVMSEVVRAVYNDLSKHNIEINLKIDDTTPKQMYLNKGLFIQVLINMLLETVRGMNDKGSININTIRKRENMQYFFQVNLQPSNLQLNKEKKVCYFNLASEEDTTKILKADVFVTFKIAKILCNMLKWKLQFNPAQGNLLSLQIPFCQDQLNEDLKQHNNQQENKHQRPTTVPPKAFKPSNQDYQTNQKYINNYDQFDEANETNQKRPQTSIVTKKPQPLHSPKQSIFPVREEPQLENEIDSPSLFGNSTKTLGMNSNQKKTLIRNILIEKVQQMEVWCLLMNFTDLEIYENLQNLKCVETFTERDCLGKIQNGLNEPPQFKLLLIDYDPSVNLQYLVKEISDKYDKHQNKSVHKIKVMLFYEQLLPDVMQLCNSLDVVYVKKPESKQELVQMLGQHGYQIGVAAQETM